MLVEKIFKMPPQQTLTQVLRESEALRLKPNSNYPFKNFDFVKFLENSKWSYAQLYYDDFSCAFLLMIFTNSNFTTPELDEEGEPRFEFLGDIGLENLQYV